MYSHHSNLGLSDASSEGGVSSDASSIEQKTALHTLNTRPDHVVEVIEDDTIPINQAISKSNAITGRKAQLIDLSHTSDSDSSISVKSTKSLSHSTQMPHYMNNTSNHVLGSHQQVSVTDVNAFLDNLDNSSTSDTDSTVSSETSEADHMKPLTELKINNANSSESITPITPASKKLTDNSAPSTTKSTGGRTSLRYFVTKSIDVMCYNCKERGHYAIQCPNAPKLQACFVCASTKHRSSECPNSYCRRCHRPGHDVRDCTQSIRFVPSSTDILQNYNSLGIRQQMENDAYVATLPIFHPDYTDSRADNVDEMQLVRCIVCGKKGHVHCGTLPLSKRKPREKNLACQNCGDTGHHYAICSSQQMRLSLRHLDKVCHICGEQGHIAAFCTSEGTNDSNDGNFLDRFGTGDIGRVDAHERYEASRRRIYESSGGDQRQRKQKLKRLKAKTKHWESKQAIPRFDPIPHDTPRSRNVKRPQNNSNFQNDNGRSRSYTPNKKRSFTADNSARNRGPTPRTGFTPNNKHQSNRKPASKRKHT